VGALTIAAFGGAISGVVSAFFRKALDSGEKWFGESLKDHQPQAIEKANANVIAFLELLKRKIERLAADATGMEERLNWIRTAMDEPSFAVCFKTAMLQAALTSDSNKHTVLAGLVAERLSSREDDLYTVVIPHACECMGMLTGNQLRILALCLCIWLLGRKGKSSSLSVQAPRLQDIHKLVPSTIVTDLDLLHLDGVSCIHIIGDLQGLVDDLNLLIKPSDKWTKKETENVRHLVHLSQKTGLIDARLVFTFEGVVIATHVYEILAEPAAQYHEALSRLRLSLRTNRGSLTAAHFGLIRT
jgi:hypothetical protein